MNTLFLFFILINCIIALAIKKKEIQDAGMFFGHLILYIFYGYITGMILIIILSFSVVILDFLGVSFIKDLLLPIGQKESSNEILDGNLLETLRINNIGLIFILILRIFYKDKF